MTRFERLVRSKNFPNWVCAALLGWIVFAAHMAPKQDSREFQDVPAMVVSTPTPWNEMLDSYNFIPPGETEVATAWYPHDQPLKLGQWVILGTDQETRAAWRGQRYKVLVHRVRRPLGQD